MKFYETELPGAFVVDIEPREDSRGFFARTWCARELAEQGLNINVVQANMAYNTHKGTLRGMHYQVAPYAEAKLVRCTRGAIFDVIVDLRPDSPTYKRWLGVELTADNRRSLYVPEGFGHGYMTLEDTTEVMYQVTAYYTPGAEGGLRYDDPAFGIQWPLPVAVISEKDASWPDFQG
jgi:dTDP-4-dehydrorhamnose 3,5-epimerase